MSKESEFGRGYDVGQRGMMQAIATAELTATLKERSRIIELLEIESNKYAKLLELRPNRFDDAVNHAIARTYQKAIALIKGENK